MPRGNKKGPQGEGPNTGRGLGYCTGHDEPGYTSDAPRRGGEGFGRGSGLGRGQGRGQGLGRGQGGAGRGMGRGQGRGLGLGRGMGLGPGRARGLGRGQGLGLRRGLGHETDPDSHDELTSLRRRVQELEKRLDRETDES